MHRKTIREQVTKRIQSNTPGLAEALAIIPYLSISWRKVFTNSCQTGLPIDQDPNNMHEATNLNGLQETEYNGHLYTLQMMISISQVVTTSPLVRSLYWMFLRTTEEKGIQEGADIAEAGFLKEFRASQTVWSEEQLFDYGELSGRRNPQVVGRWIAVARHFAGNLRRHLSKWEGQLLFPTVNRRKNVAQETQAAYLAHDETKRAGEIRTIDLELLYARTGIQVKGNCEMRSAWRFNDLKPRLYYAMGGQQYWSCRYMRRIATAFMESLPYTQQQRRTDPCTWLNMDLNNDDYVVYWDMTSFTTNLSELKFFLNAVSRMLEEEHRGIRKMQLFDYRYGIVERDVWEILDEYNEVANCNAPFSIHRLIDKFGFDIFETHTTYTQANSGMLGVHGNIGLSTTLHGYHAGRHFDPYRNTTTTAVSVGDDAIKVMAQDPEIEFLPNMSRLGSIHPEKIGILPPMTMGETRYGKFLKRLLTRDLHGLSLDHLFSFPISALADGVIPEHRSTFISFSESDRIIKFSGMVGALLWDILDHSYLIEDDDLELLFAFLHTCYKTLGLRTKGYLPGNSFAISYDPEWTTPVPIPCIAFSDFDPRRQDWAEFLYDNCPDRHFTINVASHAQPYRGPLYVGNSFYARHDGLLQALEDLGVLETKKVKEDLDACGEDNRRRFLNLVSRSEKKGPNLLYVSVLTAPPVWYDELFRLDLSVPLEEAVTAWYDM